MITKLLAPTACIVPVLISLAFSGDCAEILPYSLISSLCIVPDLNDVDTSTDDPLENLMIAVECLSVLTPNTSLHPSDKELNANEILLRKASEASSF